MINFAPIVLFVFNRPWHTQKTIEALKRNTLAHKSELFIFSDAPRNKADERNVLEVRHYINSIDGFKKVTILERKHNWGLANSIINGVTKIINVYSKVIILEDDLVTSPEFLTFMNRALNYYENKNKVWHISGWNYPIKLQTNTRDVFLWRTMNCWGWATWLDRWQYYEKNTDRFIKEFTVNDIELFNLDGTTDFWSQMLLNKSGKLDTWAIYWYATIYKHGGLCLNPVQSFVRNIGLDGSGTNCGRENDFTTIILNENQAINFETELKENEEILELIKIYHRNKKKDLPGRIINKLSRMIIGRNIIT